MPDLTAGSTILALDFPPAVEIRQATTDTVTWTAYAATDPSCEGTFVAGTTGRELLHLFIRIQAGTSGDLIETSVEVREDDGVGTLVHSPDETVEGIDHLPATAAFNQNVDGWVYLSGLTPGQTYWVQMQHNVDTGDSVSMLEQVVICVPLP